MGMYLSFTKQISIYQFNKSCEVLNLPKPYINNKEAYAYIDKELYDIYCDYLTSNVSSDIDTYGQLTLISIAESHLMNIVQVYLNKVLDYEIEYELDTYDKNYKESIKDITIEFS